MSRLIHLNGPPGIGKSTLARRYTDDHPGVLLCDIDRLRTMIGRWQADDGAAGRIRTAALAMITAYLRTGHDVVVPQLVASRGQLDRFSRAAAAAEAGYVHILLTAPADDVLGRARARTDSDDEWHVYTSEQLDKSGGSAAILEWSARLNALPGHRVASSDVATTYDALLRAIG
jgi:predicted kinase